jgi:23S rRNA (cytosine1962-C5)-methyltransferase
MNALPEITLERGRDKRALSGHPWIFSNEIAMTGEAKLLAPGSLVTLRTGGGERLGLAIFNPHSLIAARVLTRDARATIDADFFAARFARAHALRARLVKSNHHRLAHAEADGFPGLIVDRYGDTLVAQANTAGMETLSPLWIEALMKTLAPRRLILRNDSPARAQEGLPQEVKAALGDLDAPVVVEENGARFRFLPNSSQKTGWFFDQRDNRAFVASLAEGARVLDVYAYAGGFAVQAALKGASEVLAVDRSAAALESARWAAAENGVGEKVKTGEEEAFEALDRLAAAGERYGLVVVDPPAFIKSRKDHAAGLRGYAKLAKKAAKLVAHDGFLVICSCSHHASPEEFGAAVRAGLLEARRTGRILRSSGAAPDHPVHPLLPETAYLKCIVAQVD